MSLRCAPPNHAWNFGMMDGEVRSCDCGTRMARYRRTNDGYRIELVERTATLATKTGHVIDGDLALSVHVPDDWESKS